MKKVLSMLILGGILMFTLSGCFGAKYQVTCEEWFNGNKGTYRAGEKVTLYYKFIATDTNYTFYVDGEQFNPDYDDKKGYIISFAMPEHDVTVSVESRNTMLLEPDNKAEITFQSFDGGGPEYNVVIDDLSIVTFDQTVKYNDKNHDEMTGAGYNVYITFFGLKPGTTTAKIECRSPIADNYDVIYDVVVNNDLSVSLTEREQIDIIRD